MLETWPSSVAVPGAAPPPVSCAAPPASIVHVVVNARAGVSFRHLPMRVQLPAHATRTMLDFGGEPVGPENAVNAAAPCLFPRTFQTQGAGPPGHTFGAITLVGPSVQRPRMWWTVQPPVATARRCASDPAFSAPCSAQLPPGLVAKTLTRSSMTHFCGAAAAPPVIRQALVTASASARRETRRILCIPANVTPHTMALQAPGAGSDPTQPACVAASLPTGACALHANVIQRSVRRQT